MSESVEKCISSSSHASSFEHTTETLNGDVFIVPIPIKAKKRTVAPKDGTNKSKAPSTKKVKLNDSDARELVHKYMKEQNRPYSAQNIFDNLHGNISKPTLQKILDELSSDSKSTEILVESSIQKDPVPISEPSTSTALLLCKEYGKFKVYLINQKHLKLDSNPNDGQSAVNTENLMNVEAEVRFLAQEVKELQQSAGGGLFAQYSLEELSQIKTNLIKEVKVKRATFSELSTQNQDLGNTLTIEEIQQLQQNRTKALKAWKFRRDLCYRMLDSIAVTLEQTVEEVMFSLGVDSDEEFRITLPREF